jgi:hypothetical protein
MKWLSTHIMPANCERMVAVAAPRIPQPSQKIKTGARIMLHPTVSIGTHRVTNRSTDVSFRGNTNCNFQFLPIYRESENFYLPLLVPPTVVFITLPAVTTSLVGTERYLAQYACIRSVSVYHSLPDAGTSY